MQSKKCTKCGLVSWADSTACKRCGEPLLQQSYDPTDMPAPLSNRLTSVNMPGLVSGVLFALVLSGLVFGRYLGMFGYPMMILALLTGFGYSIWRVYRSTSHPRLDSKRQAITALVVNAVILMVLGAAVPVVFLRARAVAKPVQWREYLSASGRYAIQLPGDPQDKQQTIPTAAGPITLNGVIVNMGQNGEYVSGYFEIADLTLTVSDEEFLDGVFQQTMSQQKRVVLDKRPIAVDSAHGLTVTALEAEVQRDQQMFGNTVSIFRMYWVKDRSTIYVNVATARRSPDNSAAAAKFLNSFQLLTQQDINDKQSYAFGSTPLVDAAKDGNDLRIKSLLEQGVSQQEKDRALVQAVYAKRAGVVEQLTNAGANPNAKDAKEQTVLMVAVVRARSCVPVLINAGADVNAKSRDGRSVLMIAQGPPSAGPSVDPDRVAIVELLKKAGAVE